MQALLWILMAAATLAAVYFTWRADKRRAVPWPWLTALLRGLSVALVFLLLLAPSVIITRNETKEPVVVLLQDDSQSIPESLKGDTAAFRRQFEELASRLKGRFRVVRWSFGSSVLADTLYRYRRQSTDIAAALDRVQEFYGQQNLGAVVLASDGRFNQGVNPLFQNLAVKSPLYAVPLGDSTAPKDLRIGDVYANRTVARGSQFEIRADIIALGCDGYSNPVTLEEPEAGTLGSVPVQVNGDRYDRAVSFSVSADKPGLHHYVLSLPLADGESNTANNRRDVFVEVVEEKKNILLFSAAPHPDVNAIREALQGLESYNVTVRTADNPPASVNDYQVLIFHGMPPAGGQIPAGKPVWYIASANTDLQVLNAQQDAVALNGSAQYRHDVYGAPVSSFGLFSLPAGIQAVADRLPPLSVPNASVRAGAATSLLFTQKGEGSDQPLWVLQSGAVPKALLLGEGLWRWRLYEYRYFNRHLVVDECIRQTVAFLAANASEKPFRVEMPKHVWSDQENISFNAYLLNPSNEPVNTPDARLTIRDSAGQARTFSFEKAGNAYRLNIGVWAGGTYSYTAQCNYNGRALAVAGSFVVQNQPLELIETGADYAFLNSLAHKYNGRTIQRHQLDDLYKELINNKDIRPQIQSNTESVPLINWKWYFFLLLLLATAEWLLRKYWLAQ